ncbi:MAG: hypothetical protein HOV70_24230, partial [Streptomyces sp.]|nr:hypothetical protein [Streptomyces sp.]
MTQHRTHSRPGLWALLIAAALALPSLGLLPVATAAEQPSVTSTSTVAEAAVQTHGLKGEYFSMSAPGARDFA